MHSMSSVVVHTSAISAGRMTCSYTSFADRRCHTSSQEKKKNKKKKKKKKNGVGKGKERRGNGTGRGAALARDLVLNMDEYMAQPNPANLVAEPAFSRIGLTLATYQTVHTERSTTGRV